MESVAANAATKLIGGFRAAIAVPNMLATTELEKAVPGTMLLTKPFGAATLVEAVQKLIGDQS